MCGVWHTSIIFVFDFWCVWCSVYLFHVLISNPDYVFGCAAWFFLFVCAEVVCDFCAHGCTWKKKVEKSVDLFHVWMSNLDVYIQVCTVARVVKGVYLFHVWINDPDVNIRDKIFFATKKGWVSDLCVFCVWLIVVCVYTVCIK